MTRNEEGDEIRYEHLYKWLRLTSAVLIPALQPPLPSAIFLCSTHIKNILMESFDFYDKDGF